ncbi:MAG: xanthine dehydrogenase family protein molybdopterin-binding subunit, partial [Dehalococcoidia bacterium]|nr:xanthine dehydrogenase family protein molybdopterin-binding subunit [Dehalococcoidia bacterium]
MSALSVVGKSVRRVDDVEKVTGNTRYCPDLKLPGMLHARILRSQHPHARILRIDTSKAASLKGVRTVITGKDVPSEKVGMIRDRYVLARDVVRFAGDPVAAVAADTVEIAEEAMRLIRVDYEELPAVFDVEKAMEADPPAVVHPDLFKYSLQPMSAPTFMFEPDMPNVYIHRKVRRGDVQKGFREAAVVLEDRYTAPKIHHGALETTTIIVKPERDGGLTFWATTTRLFIDKSELARILHLPPSKIRIITPLMGGNFGSKNQSQIFMAQAAVLALKAGRPVKLVLSREEDLVDGGSREDMVVYIKDGVKKDGTLIAREMKLLINIGAYSSGNMISATIHALLQATGVYRIPNCNLDAYGIATNVPPAGSFLTFGAAQVYWAMEQHMDRLAERLDLDAAEIRRRNILKEGEENPTGRSAHSIGVRECLDKAADWIGWTVPQASERGPWRKGKGIAVGCKQTASGATSVVSVKVHEDATLEIRHTALEQGMGCHTILSQIAAEEFHTSMDRVRIVAADTGVTGFESGTMGQRTTTHTGNALILACRDAKRQLFDLASAKLGVPSEGLDTADGRVFVKGVPERAVKIAELFTPLGFLVKGGELVGRGVYFAPGGGSEDLQTGQSSGAALYGYYAAAAEVAVHEETGEIKLLRLAICADP